MPVSIGMMALSTPRWQRAGREPSGSAGKEKGVLVGWRSRREETGEQGELPVNERKTKF